VRSLVPPAQGGWVNPAVPRVAFNPGSKTGSGVWPTDDSACGVLRYAGYTHDLGADNWRTPAAWGALGGQIIPELKVFTPIYVVAPASAEHAARWITEVNDIGLTSIYHDPIEFSPYLERVFGAADFDMAMIFWSLRGDPDYLFDLCHSSQDSASGSWRHNAAGMVDSWLNNLVEAIRTSLKLTTPKIPIVGVGAEYWGVFVGVTGDLIHPDDDARDMEKELDELKGWESGHKSLFLDAGATWTGVKQKIQDLYDNDKVDDEDVVVFYFSGHGYQITDTNNDERDSLDETLAFSDRIVTDDELMKEFEKFKNKPSVRLIFIFDSCHSGGMVGGEKDLQKLDNPYTILMACEEDQKAWEFVPEVGRTDYYGGPPGSLVTGHGEFTHYLLRGLQSGTITTAKRLFEYARDPTKKAAADLNWDGKRDKYGRVQVPVIWRDPPVLDVTHEVQRRLYDEYCEKCAFAYMPLYSKVYFNAHQPGLRGIINSFGYGSDNSWTYLNMDWEPGHHNERIEDGKEVVIYQLGEEPELLNPCHAHTSYAWAIMNQLFDSLIEVNPYTHEGMLWMVESWESEGPITETVTLDSENRYLGVPAGGTVDIVDGMKITFNLRTDVEWHDGNLYTPSDAEFNLEFLRNNEIPRYASLWMPIVDVQVISSTAFTVYSYVTSQWLIRDIANAAALLPPPVWSRLDGKSLSTILGYNPATNTTMPTGAGPRFGTDACPTQLYGTGPFVFVDYHSGAMYTDMPANRYYFKETAEIHDQIVEMFYYVGDVDRNGEIWGVDKVRYAESYGYELGEPEYDADCDISGPEGIPDGKVDAWDGILINFFWGNKREYP